MPRLSFKDLRYALASALEEIGSPQDQVRHIKPPRGANWELQAIRFGDDGPFAAIRPPQRDYTFRMKDKFGPRAGNLYLGIREEPLEGFVSPKRAMEAALTPPHLKADYERQDFGRDILRSLIGRAADVTWSGHPGSIGNKKLDAKYGLSAMRNVIAALEYDAKKYKPKWYSFYGATSKHDKLYDSLRKKMRRAGYQAITPDRHNFFLRRVTPTLRERVVSDLAATAPLGALGYYASGDR